MLNQSQLRKGKLENLTFNLQKFHRRGDNQSNTFSSAEHENNRIKHGLPLTPYYAFFPSNVPLRLPIGQINFLVTKLPQGIQVESTWSRDGEGTVSKVKEVKHKH